MKSHSFALVRLAIITMPLYLLGFLPGALFSSLHTINRFGYNGLSEVLSNMGMMFSLIIGMGLFQENAGKRWSMPTGLRHAEFLITRPIGRLRIYFTSIALFFIFALAPIALPFAAVHESSNLRLSLVDYYDQPTKAGENLGIYRSIFPNSSIESEGTKSAILILPYGLTFVKIWQLWTLVAACLLIQVASLARFPSEKLNVVVFTVIYLGLFFILGLASLSSVTEKIIEGFFLSFVRHWAFFISSGFLIFIAIQLWAVRRVRQLEVL